MSGLTNAQADEAEQIKSLMDESDAAHRVSVDKALEAGLRLIEAKSACAHGTWLPFLKRVGVQERKAQRLMKLAQSGLKSDTVTDLGGIRGALEFLRLRKLAHAQMLESAVAFEEGRFGYDALVPLETSIILADKMIGMFASEFDQSPAIREDS